MTIYYNHCKMQCTHLPYKFFLVFIFLFFFFLPVESGWWNDEWTRKKPINVSVANGTTPAGYQIALNITYDTDMSADFGDLRFVNSFENAELPYWIETKHDGSWAFVWVRIDQNITTTNYTFYMYYGNPYATNKSDGDATFDFFDGFSETILNTTKWVNHSTRFIVSNGTIRINTGGIERTSAFPFKFADGYIAEVRVRHEDITTLYGGVLPSVSSSSFTVGGNANADATILYMREANTTRVRTWIGNGATTGYNEAVVWADWHALTNVWYVTSISVFGGRVDLWVNRTSIRNFTGISWAKEKRWVKLGSFHRSAVYDIHDTTYDWILVRKHHIPSPVVSIGKEISYTCYSHDGGGTCTVRRGEGCDCINLALNDNTLCFREVRLSSSIINHNGTCIDNPLNFSNKIFNCQGNIIDGVGRDSGIYLDNKQNNTIKNCVITEFNFGINLFHSSNTTITNNTVNNNIYGTYLLYSSGVTVANNIASNNTYGINLTFSLYNIITNNTVNNNTHGICVYTSPNNKVINNTMNNNAWGVYLYNSSYNIITNNTANNNYNGIHFEHMNNNNTLTNNKMNNNKRGVYFNAGNYNNTLFLNYVCNSSECDICAVNLNLARGDNNTCNISFNYNDHGSIGCDYPCYFGKCFCSTCEECNHKLSHFLCLEVNLIADIIDHPGTCINNPTNFSNKIFDCQRHRIDGTGISESYGIFITEKINNTIRNCLISDFAIGIYLNYLSNNTLFNNTVNNTKRGIFLFNSSNNVLINNTINNSKYGIYFDINSTNNTLIFNFVCNNEMSDIYSFVLNYARGSNNTCQKTFNYRDDEKENCTFKCFIKKRDLTNFTFNRTSIYANANVTYIFRWVFKGKDNNDNTGLYAIQLFLNNTPLIRPKWYNSSDGEWEEYTFTSTLYPVYVRDKGYWNLTLIVDYYNNVTEENENNEIGGVMYFALLEFGAGAGRVRVDPPQPKPPSADDKPIQEADDKPAQEDECPPRFLPGFLGDIYPHPIFKGDVYVPIINRKYCKADVFIFFGILLLFFWVYLLLRKTFTTSAHYGKRIRWFEAVCVLIGVFILLYILINL